MKLFYRIIHTFYYVRVPLIETTNDGATPIFKLIRVYDICKPHNFD